jgi:hypothetical protein
MKLKFPRRRTKKLDVEDYTKRWSRLQKMCATRKTWPQSIAEADALLDRALKQRRYKGKTIGERLVAAQHDLTANDKVWFSHKYSKQLGEGVDVRTLKKNEMAEALMGFRQALRDLGALEEKEK